MPVDASDKADIAEATRPLHLLTIDVALADLISGRKIGLDTAETFGIPSVEARSILDWYRRHRPKWAGNLHAVDGEAIVDSIAAPPAALAAATSTVAGTRPLLRLARIVAHRFAGLHAYAEDGAAPPPFVFEPDRPITLFEGWNGSGKTSLANAMIWCLTGQILRPQRLPEKGDMEFACIVSRDEGVSEHNISAVTPLPHGMDGLPDAAAKVVPADTWVELIFADESGALLPPVRRVQSRKTNGKLVETEPDFTVLGVDPVALQLGTTMPSMLPFLQIGNASELGLAVARLTGLASFVDLAKHAGKARTLAAGKMTKALRDDVETWESRYGEAEADLTGRIGDFPDMAPPIPIPTVDVATAATDIFTLKAHFEYQKATGLTAARDVLGDGFDPEEALARQNLESCTQPAFEQLRQMKSLAGIARLSALKIDAEDATRIRELLTSLRDDAATLADLIARPVLARRLQLYARVTSWAEAHDEDAVANCAICRSDLRGVIDPETSVTVVEHLQAVCERSDLIARTVKDWSSAWTGTLSRDVPAAFSVELTRDLPAAPVDLLRSGLIEDLFAADSFKGTLAALKPLMTSVAERKLATLPSFAEPAIEPLPASIAPQVQALVKMVARLERALAFAEWRKQHQQEIVDTLMAIRGNPGDAGADADAIGAKLQQLDTIVKGVAPISAAIALCDRLSGAIRNRRTKLDRIEACRKAALALAEIEPIGDVAQAQVDHLRQTLQGRSDYWRDRIYQGATAFAPRPRSTGMDAKGVIDIAVGRGPVSAPAQHVSNASALRASLFGFFLAFREHVLKTSGGLRLLVLDDPQDLLDHDNRRRLSRALSELAASGDRSQILATTHDRAFAAALVQEARGGDLIVHRSVHPVHTGNPTLRTALAFDDLDRKRAAFLANDESASHAQDYVQEVRVFLEVRLGDLFDDPAYPAFSTVTKAPTLDPLYNRLKGLAKAKPNDLFKSSVIAKFCEDKALAEGADARRILNAAHHRDKAGISYSDVKRIDDDLRRLRSGIEDVHAEFRRYRWREPLHDQQPETNVVRLRPVAVSSFDIPLYPDIAAFTGSVSDVGSQDVDVERLVGSRFDDTALFYIRHETLGFAMPSGCVAIVEAESAPGHDRNLVVARHKRQVFARRLLKPVNGDGIALVADIPDPREGRPTLRFDERQVEVHRIVGCLLTDMPPPEGSGEAIAIDEVPDFGSVRIAYRVREESAVPFALPHQIVLAGDDVEAHGLDALEGRIVAVTLDTGVTILKRAGGRLPGKLTHLRQLEKIGASGDSIVVATEPDEDADMPVVVAVRQVIGVLYR
ncbi:ATP-binding protein [Sphingomonas sp. M6A6_1c]